MMQEQMIIHKAGPEQYSAVRAFYHSLIDAGADLPYSAGWKKDIYPAPDFLADSIRNGELYIGIRDEKIIASMVVNHQCNDGYLEFTWPTEAEAHEVTVIHALGVHPAECGKGYAKQMVRFVIEKARAERKKAVRLDVLNGNVPAGRLYAGLGFQYLHTLRMFYADTGWTDYDLYEYRIAKIGPS